MKEGDVVEQNGQLYKVVLYPVYRCHRCSVIVSNPYATKFHDRLNQTYCRDCAKHLCRNSPWEKYSANQRAERVLSRLSRDRVLSPQEVMVIHRQLSIHLRSKRLFSEAALSSGVYRGKPLLSAAGAAGDFWEEVQRQKITSPRLELAVLLLICGDKHAIAHSASRNTTLLRGGKAAHSGNDSQHPRRRT